MNLFARHRRRTGPRPARTVAAALAMCALCACRAATPAPPATPPGSGPTGGRVDQLVTEPGDGISALYQLLSAAHTRVDMTMYELVDPHAEAILAADAARHVTVRVVLDHNREGAANQAACTYLAARGVAVRWAPGGFAADHEKSVVVDRDVAVIGTLNLVARDYPATRDFAVIDRNPADVAAIDDVFAADFAGADTTAPAGADLLWSPGAQGAMVAFITSAQHRVAVENEEMSDPAVIAALAGDARRGIDVTLTMTAAADWAAAFATLTAAGVHVHVDTGQTLIYIHAKVAVADAGTGAARALVGSQNDTVASLTYNRELGIYLNDPATVASLAATLASDYAAATPWQP